MFLNIKTYVAPHRFINVYTGFDIYYIEFSIFQIITRTALLFLFVALVRYIRGLCLLLYIFRTIFLHTFLFYFSLYSQVCFRRKSIASEH